LREIYGEDNKGRTILLITDGQVGNEAPILDLIRDHAPGTRFFTIGIGYGSNEHMLREAARMGNGACEMIAPGERIEHKALRLFGKMMGNSVLDVKISGEGRIDQSPSALVLFTGEMASVFGRLKGKASLTLGAVRVTGTMEGKEVSWEIPVSTFTGKDSPVPTLWARESIRDIEEGSSPAFAGGSRQERRKAEKAKEAVVALSKEFGIASSHASIVAIEEREEKDKATGEVVLRKIPVMIPKGWHGMDSRFANADLVMPISPVPYQIADMAMRSSIKFVSSRAFNTFDEKAPVLAMDDSRTARLMDILACQRAEGGFSLDTKGAKALGVSLKVLKDAAKKVSASQGVDGYVLVCTALVFAYLTGPAADMRETWGPVAEKSRKWLMKITKASAPKIGGETLASWASTVTMHP
jgi:Ca-activated chloride channel homolog